LLYKIDRIHEDNIGYDIKNIRLEIENKYKLFTWFYKINIWFIEDYKIERE
jgi:hypothetical protein